MKLNQKEFEASKIRKQTALNVHGKNDLKHKIVWFNFLLNINSLSYEAHRPPNTECR